MLKMRKADTLNYRQEMNKEAVKLSGKLTQASGFFFERGAEKIHFKNLAVFEEWVKQQVK
jgi:hypothetical protein